VPTVTFLGPHSVRRSPDGLIDPFSRGIPSRVSQAWIDEWRHRLPASHWTIEGDGGKTADAGSGGVPDSSWRRKDIITWVAAYDAKPKGYATKTQLLDIVDALMNPDRVEEVEDLVEEPEEEEPEEEALPEEEEGNLDEAPPSEENEGE